MKSEFVVSFKESKQPLKDMLIPIQKRIGYMEGATPIIPIYFYRYVGINGLEPYQQDAYYNEIYELEEQLKEHSIGYIRLESSIAMPNNEEIAPISHLLGQAQQTSHNSLVSHMMNLLKDSRMFMTSRIYHQIEQAFLQLLMLYTENEWNANSSKIENFCLKMMVWLKRYYPQLFKKDDLSDVPKVIFYGDIKSHEAYFITFLAFIGIDVLFIHTDKSKDQYFFQIDSKNIYSRRIELPSQSSILPFPIIDKRVRKKTVAYEASQQIDSFLYGDDVGIFKARQYEEGTTKPITLKTTYDEMKILWNEESKIRPEFRVKNNTVYVPNFFVKINGTYQDIDDYWDEIYELADAEHTVLLKEVGFAPIRYTRQELYSTVFLLNQEGLVDKSALIQHSVYPLGYLKDTTQDFIIAKINELILSDMLLKEMDIDLKVKILMTIITMDSSFLRLVESFDYTGRIPKIIVYDYKRDNFSESDIILLAFFNLIGADILIFTPTNYNNIEQWIKRDYFDIHQLPSVQFDVDLPERKPKKSKGFFQRLFNR